MLKIHLGLQMAVSSHTPQSHASVWHSIDLRINSPRQLVSCESGSLLHHLPMTKEANLRKQTKKQRDEEWKTGGLHAGSKERKGIVFMKKSQL